MGYLYRFVEVADMLCYTLYNRWGGEKEGPTKELMA